MQGAVAGSRGYRRTAAMDRALFVQWGKESYIINEHQAAFALHLNRQQGKNIKCVKRNWDRFIALSFRCLC
jgi:hypothetical protein